MIREESEYKKKFQKVLECLLTCQGYATDVRIEKLIEYMNRLIENTDADPLEGWDREEESSDNIRNN